MASNILSRLLPSASDDRPIFENTQRQHHRQPADLEDHLGLEIDEENLGERFQDQDLEHLLADAAASQITTESAAFVPQNKKRGAPARQPSGSKTRPEWIRSTPSRGAHLDDDDDVPESLLLEGFGGPLATTHSNNGRNPLDGREGLPPPVPGPTTRRTRAQWEATRMQQRLHEDRRTAAGAPRWTFPGRASHISKDPKERAMWLWVNVQDLDAFLGEVYSYFVGHGIWSILLHKALALL